MASPIYDIPVRRIDGTDTKVLGSGLKRPTAVS